ncbi:hypothetical protein HUU40_00080 [candidate division KSB1 bacterium]|nr:hypothetical protein [candidate division KSB1 bacterium]
MDSFANQRCGWRYGGFFLSLADDLAEAVSIQLRFYTPDENGETREELHERFDEAPPPPRIIPEAGETYWQWYWEISDTLRRVTDGAPNPIPPTEYLAWAQMTGRIVWPSEYAILQAMDRAFCKMTGQEIKEYMERKFPPKQKGK